MDFRCCDISGRECAQAKIIFLFLVQEVLFRNRLKGHIDFGDVEHSLANRKRGLTDDYFGYLVQGTSKADSAISFGFLRNALALLVLKLQLLLILGGIFLMEHNDRGALKSPAGFGADEDVSERLIYFAQRDLVFLFVYSQSWFSSRMLYLHKYNGEFVLISSVRIN